MIDGLVKRAGILTLLVLLSLIAAMAVRPVYRALTTPPEMRFLPGDAAVIAMVPDAEKLAAQIHSHVCPYTGDPAEACFYRLPAQPAGLLSDLFNPDADRFDTLRAFEPIEALRRMGLDTSAPVFFALRGPATALDFVLVASLREGPDVCDSLTADGGLLQDFDFEGGHTPCAQLPGPEANGVDEYLLDAVPVFYKKLNGPLVAFYSSQDTFNAVWAARNKPVGLLAQDGFNQAFRSLSSQGEPAAWAYVRHPGLTAFAPMALTLTFDADDPALGLQPADRAAAQAALDETLSTPGAGRLEPSFMEGAGAIRVSAWIAPSALYSLKLDQFLNEDPPRGVSFTDLGNGVSLVLSANDAMQYLRFAEYGLSESLPDALFTGQSALMPDLARFGRVLSASMGFISIQAVDVQLAGFQDRVPDLAIRFAVSPGEAGRLVQSIQIEEQIARDRAILAAILEDGTRDPWIEDCAFATEDEKQQMAAVISLAARAVSLDLSATPGGFAHAWCDEIALDSAAFLAPSGHVFLQPALTEDDFTYRFAGEADLEDARAALIEEDRFRMVSHYDEKAGQLWIASDPRALERLLAEKGAPRNADHRLELVIDPRRLYDLMIAAEYDQADDDLATLATVVEELTVYRRLELSLETKGDQRGARLDVALYRR